MGAAVRSISWNKDLLWRYFSSSRCLCDSNDHLKHRLWWLWLAPTSNLLQRWMLRARLVLLSSHGPCLADRWWFFLTSAVDLLCSRSDPGTWWFWWRHHVIVIIEGGLCLLTWHGSPSLLSKGASEILSWCLTAEWTSDNLTFSSSARTFPPLPRLLHPQLNAWLSTPGSVPPLSSPFCFVSNIKKGWIVLFPWPPSSPRCLPFSFHIRQLSSFIHSPFTSSACH